MATPIQFQQFTSAPKSARLVADQRLEYATGYLSPTDLGINALVLAPVTGVYTPNIYSPGLNSFTCYFSAAPTNPNTTQVFLEILDPRNGVPVYWFLLAPAYQVADDATTIFNLGVSGRFNVFNTSQAAWVWACWRLLIVNFDVDPVAVTLEIYANARMR